MRHHTANNYRFPWRTGNHFQLLVDGDSFYPAMLEAIQAARHCIGLEMYLVESGKVMDQFIDIMNQAARRGVHIFLLFDDFGARGLKKRDRQRLSHSNIKLNFYNPLRYGKWRRLLFRDHRKLLLIDNHTAFIGGAGISDHFVAKSAWHDIMIKIQGSCVQDWQQLFLDHWDGSHEDYTCLDRPAELSIQQGQLGRVSISQMSNRQEIQRSLIKRLKNAEHWIWITTAYFVPSWKLRRALKSAARRGVDVRLILPGSHTDHPAVRHAGRRFYYSLLRHGVRIFEYQPHFNHGKAYLCDHWCSIGSSNLDRWNLLWNLEGNQEIDDQAFCQTLTQMFQQDLEQCVEMTYPNWITRPQYRRFLEWFWGRLDIWLARLSNQWGRRP